MSKATGTSVVKTTGEVTIPDVGLLATTVARKPMTVEDQTRQARDAVLADQAGDAVKGMAMWNLGLLTFNAFYVSKIVGGVKGVTVEKGSVPFGTQAEYATSVLGFREDQKSYFSRIVRLGRAAMVHGIRHGSTDWSVLLRNADKAPFSALLMGDDTAALRQALADHKAGKVADKAARKAQPDEGDKGAEKGAEKSSEAVKVVTAGDVTAAIREVIAPALARLSDADAEGVHQYLVNLIRKDQEARRLIAEKAARNGTVKAPRKAPSKASEKTPEAAPEATPEVPSEA